MISRNLFTARSQHSRLKVSMSTDQFIDFGINRFSFLALCFICRYFLVFFSSTEDGTVYKSRRNIFSVYWAANITFKVFLLLYRIRMDRYEMYWQRQLHVLIQTRNEKDLIEDSTKKQIRKEILLILFQANQCSVNQMNETSDGKHRRRQIVVHDLTKNRWREREKRRNTYQMCTMWRRVAIAIVFFNEIFKCITVMMRDLLLSNRSFLFNGCADSILIF